MPRAKSNKASPNFISYGHRLSDKATSELVNLLGYRLADLAAESVPHQLTKIIHAVEQALGFYVDGAPHLDSPPRATHYVIAFKPIERDARRFSETLFEMGEYFSTELSSRGVDPNGIAAELVKLAEVSKAVISNFKGKPSKGAHRNTALTEVIRRLRRIFRDGYRGELTGRTKRGAFQFRAEEEKREIAFVKTALRDARIIPASYKELPRLFRDPRCTLHEERAAVVECIANKVRHRRERKQKGNIR